MPLSEHEQRMLDQIERALYAEDPKFANTVRQTNPQVHYKRWIVKASIGFVIGVIVMMSAVIMNQPFVAAVGFAIMLGCFVWGLSGWRRVVGGGGTTGTDESSPRQRRAQRPGMMDRFEERWRKRQEGE